MTVRRAQTSDIPAILDFMEDYHRDSNLADIAFDRKTSFKTVDYYIQHKTYMPLIALGEDGAVVGLLFGSLEPFFFNAKRTYATDLMFISRGHGEHLWRQFRDWAFSSGADRLLMGVSSGEERSSRLLEALGMTRVGGMYVLRS